MKTWEFAVSLNGGWCNGILYIEANNYDEAYEKAQDEVCEGLRYFPLVVEYDVECVDEPDDEEEDEDVI